MKEQRQQQPKTIITMTEDEPNYPKYITFSIKYVTEQTRRHYAIKCHGNMQINNILADLCSYDGVSYIRVNNKGKFHRNKNNIKMFDGNHYFDKGYFNF